ncbi:MAG: hypothetical protein AB1700_12380 [Bacillota bacterium]
MISEAQRFLDLDMVAQTITDGDDRGLFLEAVQCYQIGSHRAAVILTWCATADCLRRRIRYLADEGDAEAQEAEDELGTVEGQASYEEKLISCARRCELIDDFDEKCLRFARDTRSQCAHPTGVVPSAEAVRHILRICTQCVLSRRGYRGMAFVRDVVTTQFDDPYFLPNDSKTDEYCRTIIDKVPRRLWPQFTRIAAQERPGPPAEAWQRNAIRFFRNLLAGADDGTAHRIAAGLQGFEATAPDFFAVLVGIDRRVATFWDAQKRDQARTRLRALPGPHLSADEVHSWVTICAASGLEEGDRDLLRQKFGFFARFLVHETEFLVNYRDDVIQLLQEMLLDDACIDHALIGLKHLIGSRLFEEKTEPMQVIIETLIERFTRNERCRQLMENTGEWAPSMLVILLELSEHFLSQCSEDNPDDVMVLLGAARELARRSPVLVPDAFSEVSNRILRGEVLPEWTSRDSMVGGTFRSQLALMLQQSDDVFPKIDATLLASYEDSEGPEES